MQGFPLVETLRRELQAEGFRPMDDIALQDARLRFAEMHHSNAIEGVAPDRETAALFEMLFVERVPVTRWEAITMRFMSEHLGSHRDQVAIAI
jgi:hypothetical protein